LKKMIRS